MAEIFKGATEFRRMSLTFLFGSVADIDKVGVETRTDPNDIPDPGADETTLGDFTEVVLDGSDILVKIGPWDGDINPAAGAGTSTLYQVFAVIQTTGGEKIIKKPSTLSVIGSSA